MTARNLKMICLFMELFKTVQHFKCIIKSKIVMFLSFRKNKETKRISMQILKNVKGAVVSLPKICRSKIFLT